MKNRLMTPFTQSVQFGSGFPRGLRLPSSSSFWLGCLGAVISTEPVWRSVSLSLCQFVSLPARREKGHRQQLQRENGGAIVGPSKGAGAGHSLAGSIIFQAPGTAIRTVPRLFLILLQFQSSCRRQSLKTLSAAQSYSIPKLIPINHLRGLWTPTISHYSMLMWIITSNPTQSQLTNPRRHLSAK